MIPPELRYTADHEWVRQSNSDSVRVGITDYAQNSLGDIVFVQLPDVGADVTAGESVGEVESTKSVSEVLAPIAGTVTAVNEALEDAPERANDDPYGEGWLFEIEPADPSATDALLEAEGYADVIGEA